MEEQPHTPPEPPKRVNPGLKKLVAMNTGRKAAVPIRASNTLMEDLWNLCGRRLLTIVRVGRQRFDINGIPMRRPPPNPGPTNRTNRARYVYTQATHADLAAAMKWCLAEDRRRRGKPMGDNKPEKETDDFDPEVIGDIKRRFGKKPAENGTAP